MNGPNVSGPNVSAPHVSGPNFSAPNVSGPNVSAPNVNGPNVSAPNVSGPNFSAPNVSGPNVSAPKVSGPNSLGRMSPSLPGVPGAVAPDLGATNISSAPNQAPQARLGLDSVPPAGVGIGGGGIGSGGAAATGFNQMLPDSSSGGVTGGSMSAKLLKEKIYAIPGTPGHRSACECNRCMKIRREAAPHLFADK